MPKDTKYGNLVTFDSADKLLDYLKPDAAHWLPKRIQDLRVTSGNGWVYRGQSDATWSLAPSAFRKGSPLREYAESWSSYGEGDVTFHRRSFAASHALSEQHVVNEFTLIADTIGQPTGISDQTRDEIRKMGQALLESTYPLDFARYLKNGGVAAAFPPDQLLELFALAQHHGLPTRLLDWSFSPHIAAYFAAREVYEKKVVSEHIALFAINTQKFPSTSTIRGITTTHSRNVNVRAQRGFFTFDSQADEYFLGNGKWPTLEDTPFVEVVTKLVLPSSEVKPLLRALFLLGVSPATLFPSLDAAAEQLLYHRGIFDKMLPPPEPPTTKVDFDATGL